MIRKFVNKLRKFDSKSDRDFRPGTFLREKSIFPFITSYLEDGLLILDIGGFDGYISDVIKRKYKSELIILDIDKNGLVASQSKNLITINGSATAIPIEENKFNRVISFDNIEHILEDELVISEIDRVLEPKGYLFLSTTGSNFSLPFLSNNWIKEKWGHVRVGYSEEELVNLIEKNGLSVIKIGTYNNFLTRLFYVVLFYFRIPPFFTSLRYSIFNFIVGLDQKIKIGSMEHWLIAQKN